MIGGSDSQCDGLAQSLLPPSLLDRFPTSLAYGSAIGLGPRPPLCQLWSFTSSAVLVHSRQISIHFDDVVLVAATFPNLIFFLKQKKLENWSSKDQYFYVARKKVKISWQETGQRVSKIIFAKNKKKGLKECCEKQRKRIPRTRAWPSMVPKRDSSQSRCLPDQLIITQLSISKKEFFIVLTLCFLMAQISVYYLN